MLDLRKIFSILNASKSILENESIKVNTKQRVCTIYREAILSLVEEEFEVQETGGDLVIKTGRDADSEDGTRERGLPSPGTAPALSGDAQDENNTVSHAGETEQIPIESLYAQAAHDTGQKYQEIFEGTAESGPLPEENQEETHSPEPAEGPVEPETIGTFDLFEEDGQETLVFETEDLEEVDTEENKPVPPEEKHAAEDPLVQNQTNHNRQEALSENRNNETLDAVSNQQDGMDEATPGTSSATPAEEMNGTDGATPETSSATPAEEMDGTEYTQHPFVTRDTYGPHPKYGMVTYQGRELKYGVDYIGAPPKGALDSQATQTPSEEPAYPVMQEEPRQEQEGRAETQSSAPKLTAVQKNATATQLQPAAEEFTDALHRDDFTLFDDYVTIRDRRHQEWSAEIIVAPLSMREGSNKIIAWIEKEYNGTKETVISNPRPSVFVRIGACVVEISGTIKNGLFVPTIRLGQDEEKAGFSMAENAQLLPGKKGHVACYDTGTEIHMIPLSFQKYDRNADFIYYINQDGVESFGDSCDGPVIIQLKNQQYQFITRWDQYDVLHACPIKQ